MALGIIFIFALSSIAFVFTGFGPQETNTDIKPLDSYVVNGDISSQLENAYVQGGFTFLKFYYNNETDPRIVSFAEQAPQLFTTASGQVQLIVLKIESPASYGRLVNINGAIDLPELTADSIYNSLCTSLIAPPPECAIGRINTTG